MIAFKNSVPWFLAYSRCCATIPTTCLRNFFIFPDWKSPCAESLPLSRLWSLLRMKRAHAFKKFWVSLKSVRLSGLLFSYRGWRAQESFLFCLRPMRANLGQDWVCGPGREASAGHRPSVGGEGSIVPGTWDQGISSTSGVHLCSRITSFWWGNFTDGLGKLG